MQHDRWSAPGLAREATKNIFVRHSKLGALALLAIAGGLFSALFMAGESNSFVKELAVLQQDGRDVLIFQSASADQPASIGRTSCQALLYNPGVSRAGLLVPGPAIDVVQLGQAVPTTQASTSLFPSLRQHRLLIGSALVRPTRSEIVSTSAGEAVAGFLAPQPDGFDTNSGIVTPLGSRTTSGPECVVVLDPVDNSAREMAVLQSQLTAAGNPIIGQEYLQQTLDPIADFLGRVTRFLPFAVGLAGAIAAGLRNYLRSNEFAAYRLSGTAPRSLGMIIAFEQVLVAGFGVLSGTAAVLILHDYYVSVSAALIWIIGAGALWVAGASIASLPILLRSPATLAKDR